MFDKESGVFKLKNSPTKKSINYENELDSDQIQPVKHDKGPLLVVAGAGSGKTRVLTYRVAYLIKERNVSSRNILLLTFTNKAAREMTKRVEQILGEKPEGLTGGTYHHVGNSILRKYAHLVGLQRNYTILDIDDTKSLMKQAKANSGVDIKDKRLPKEAVLKEILSLSINKQVSIEKIISSQFSYFMNAIQEIKSILGHYEQLKKKNNVVDFDDILVLWEKLLREHSSVRDFYADKVFQYIMVDEYQDSNTLQNNIVKHLAGKEQNVMVVGDPNQSIYRWRGAEIDNMFNFAKDYPNTKIYNVMYNYRSIPEILNLANNSIQYNEKRAESALKAVKKSGNKPFVLACNDTEQESTFIAERILSLLDEGADLNDIAVLYRSHFMVRDVEIQLSAKNIPYKIQSGLRFFEQKHIKDIVSFVKIIHNPQDDLSWRRTLQQVEGIGSKTINVIMDNLLAEDDILSYLKSERNFSFLKRGKQGFIDLVDIMNISSDYQNANSIIQLFLDKHYDEYMQSAFENYKDRKADVDSLIEFSHKYDNVETFLEELALLDAVTGQDKESSNEKDDGTVTLTTIHRAKGLEWKYVFVISCSDGRFPSTLSMNSPEELEEERRLFYVATTRAEKELYLTYPSRTFSFEHGMWLFTNPSMFLEELNPTYYDKYTVE